MWMSSLRSLLVLRFANPISSIKAEKKAAEPVVRIEAELAELIPQYIANRWADLSFARQLLVNSDFQLLSRMARRVRDGATSYGFTGLCVIAQGLENAAEQRDAAAVNVQLECYDAFLRSVRIEYI